MRVCDPGAVRVHVQISDPFELVPDTPRGAAVHAELHRKDLLEGNAADGPVLGIEGLMLEVERVSIRSRHVGEGLARLLAGLSVSVNGTLLMADGHTIEFIGSAHDAARAKPGSTDAVMR